MIQEITNYIGLLQKSKPEIFTNTDLGDGLYFLLDFNDDNDIQIQKAVFPTEDDLSITLREWQRIKDFMKPVSNNKSFNSSKKVFIGSANGFALVFKKKNYANKTWEVLIPIIESYFKSAHEYAEEKQHTEWIKAFESFCLTQMQTLLEEAEEYKDGKADLMIHFFLKMPPIDDYKKLYEAYLEKNLFNSPQSSIEVEKKMLGISDELNTFNDKKMFLKHKTAPFEYNFRITGETAKAVWQFFQIRGRELPNPLPIFIDFEELNGKVIETLREDKKIGYSEILKKLFETSDRKKDLGNYYLLFFFKGGLLDMDFVSGFQYEINDMIIQKIFNQENRPEKISTIFQFENKVANRLFNGQLVSNTKAGGKWLKYFGDIEYKPKYFTDNTYNQLLKYRQAFYDFIYKSKRKAIKQFMFNDILEKAILDDIRHDNKDKSTDGAIKEKMNIWFSLHNYFDSSNNNKMNMVNQTENLRNRIKEIAKKEGNDPNIRSDEEFAFAAGQLIWYLFLQSQSDNRTHALLEPFLQKTDAEIFKMEIAKTCKMYSHALTFYSSKYEFDEIMSQVMGYKTNKNIRELLPYTLAGYFSPSPFLKQKDN